MALVFFTALSFVSAGDLSDNMTVAETNDQDTIDAANVQQNIIGEGQDTFDDLDKIIHNSSIPEGGVVSLNKDYTFSDTDNSTDGIEISKNLTIDGKGYTLSGSDKSAILRITNHSHVILVNVTFTNGNATDGGAIHVESGSTIEVRDCTFQNNFASGNGGAIFIATDSLTSTSTINNSIFTQNSALGNGGAIFDTSSTLNVTLSSFSYDNATYGGGLYVGGVAHITQTTFDYETASGGGAIELLDDEENYSTIENSTFQNCYSTGDGGACYIRTSNAVMKNVKFTNNTAGDDGGAIFWEGDDGMMYNITFIECRGISLDKSGNDTSSTRGGAICLTGNNTHIYKSTFTSCSAYMDAGKNSSKVDGGAIFATGNDVIISEVTFTDCIAINAGGALYVIGNDTHIIACSFDDSTAKDGAALYVEGDLCHLYNSTFTNNVAGDDGGAIFWEGSDGMMYNITCTNNKGISSGTSSSRGGTICLTGDNVTVSRSSFKTSSVVAGSDSSKIDGGALFLTGNDIIIRESVFDDCKATNGGGAIYIIGNNTHLLDCNYTNTQALVGGAVFISGNDGVVDDSLFRYNDAKGAKPADGGTGGAIYVDGRGAIISNSDFAYDTSVRYGGSIAVWGPDAIITNNRFDNSTATEFYGGAIFVNGFNATISYSNFTRSKTINSYTRGGAIDVGGDNANIFGCNFYDCYSYFGGDIYVNGANAIIDSSNFEHSGIYNKNYPYEGGAIYVSGANTTILKSNFSDLDSVENGGAIYIAGTNTNISQSSFLECDANGVDKTHGGWGGAIYISGADTNIEKSNFTSCDALNSNSCGGAIYINGANTLIKESAFDNCEAERGRGGDIYVFGNGARIEDSTFKDSQSLYGGAIYLEAWGAVIKKSNITDCFASNNGGAIYVAGGGTNIIESSFEGCTIGATSSNDGGGAIYINGPDTHISASEFNKNVVAGSARGGAIYIMGERTIIEGSEFNASSANEGGIICIQGEEAVIDSSTFANSSSNLNGGAIYIHGHNATIRGSHFENVKSYRNSGESRGGAIYVNGENTNILTSSFDTCSAKTDGGAIYIADLGTTVAYSNFTHSSANTGGAIFINGINTTITYCNINNNTAKSAGAIKVSGSDSYISNSNISYNTATSGSGGALDIGGERASVLYSYFSFNTATGTGGAINWQGGHGNDSIIGTTFLNNSCTGQPGGGAIFWTQGNSMASGGLIKDCKFINNSAYGKHGGALNWYRTLDSTIDNCLFINNYASSDGGALYTGDQNGNSKNLTFINSQFYNNTAGKHGGAIANQMAKSYIFNITFDGNKAGYSGGSILMKEGPARDSVIDHCYIYNSYCNQKGDEYGQGGGAIHIGDDNITISNCAIINSTANKTYGGAISFEVFKDKGNKWHYARDASLINVTIQNVKTNSANGGAIYWAGDNGHIYNVTIFNSSSNSDYNTEANGGAIYISGSNGNFDLVNIASSSSNNKDMAVSNPANGGAIYVSGKNNAFTNVAIDDSQASSVRMDANGGAIYWSGSSGSLINATISNTLANGKGGAIYWGGGAKTFENISIEYSQTNVTSTSGDNGCGGAIYTTTINELKNVYIINALASAESGDIKGGAIYFAGAKLNNVTVMGSRAVTGEGTSQGGAVYLQAGSDANIYDSLFKENTADLGGALFTDKKVNVYSTSFIGNVALDGGAIYAQTDDISIFDSLFELNSAKRGGAIFTEDVKFTIEDSTLRNNTAEEKGGAIYHNYISNAVGTYIKNSGLTNNTAFQGSAIYATKFFTLTNVILLDNQANSKEFIEKHVGVDETGRNYTSAVFVGFDNVLNAIWVEEATINVACNNVTYWGVNGINVSNSKPRKSDREVWQNVTVEVFNGNGEKINEVDLITDADGRVIYYFVPEEGETYYFAYTHETDRYYTYLRDTLSNRSLVKIYAYNPIYYNQNQTLLISLTDGAWGDLNGTVTVRFNDTTNTTYIINVTNGTYRIENISGIPIGKYNVTAKFDGDKDHTGDTDWVVFEVLPYDDLHITKDVNITADYVNVTDYIKYTINVTNHGPSEGRGVNVTEILSPYLKLIKSNATRGSYNYTGGYWYIGDLGVNETVTLTIIAQVIHEGPITNTVWVTGLGNDTNLTNDIDSAHNFTALNIVDVRIVKEINASKVINVTDIIKYTITVYNDGPCNATGVVVGEVLDYHLSPISIDASVGTYANGTWNIGRLNNGTNATLTIVARVVYSGNITNEVRVNCFENDTNLTNNYDNVTNLAIAYVDLQIIKEVNTTGPVNVTDKIKFTIHIYNDGPANATGVFVSEILNEHIRMISHNETIGRFDGSTWIINNLNAKEHHNLTIIAEVISAGNITNEVNITSIDNDTNLTNNHDNITNITALPIVDLVIKKEVNVSAVVNVGSTIKFTITVHNNGPCDATNVTVREKLSKLLKVTENGINATNGTYNPTTGIWTIGDMPAYSEVVLTIICKVMTNGTIANVVAVNSTENDTNTSNNIYNITNITALPIVDISINKTVNVTKYANVSDIIKFTITVHNAGPSNATNVRFTEKISPYLRLLNTTGPGYYNRTSCVWYIGDLKCNETVNLTLVCKITGNGTVINEVNVTSYENDTNTTNNWDGLVFAALPIVDVSIIKTVNINSTTLNFKDKITFTITVHNKGPSNATGVYVNETLDTTHLKLISANATVGNYSGNTWTIGKLNNGSTAVLTIVCEAVELGNFTNFVEVFSYENDTNTSNNNDTIDNITIIPVVDLDITKTVKTYGSVVKVGDLIQFIVNVVNNGPCDATNVTVVEKLNPHLKIDTLIVVGGEYNATSGIWYIGDLKTKVQGDFAQLTIQARVISNGTISNFVVVNSTENDTNMSNNNDTIDNFTAFPVVNLIITKDVNETVVNVTDKIKYTITVYNDGPSNATQVNVTEVLDKDYLRLISSTTNAGYFNATGGYWYIGNLTNKTRVNLTIECEVIKDGFIDNYVNVTSYENETEPYNNEAKITFKALPIVDIIITKKSDFNGTVNVTDIITFTITVHNRGPSNATSVMVYEKLNSTYLRFISYNSTKGEYNGVSWFIGNLNNGSTEVLNITAEVIAAGNFSNFVNVTSYQNDTNMSNNYANITNITSYYWVDLDITKTAVVWGGTSYVLVGGNVQFTINVLNKGPCEARNVTVNETLADGLKLYSKYTATGDYNETTGIWNIGTLAKNQFAQLIIVATVMKAGNVSNFVSVNTTDNDTNMSNNNYTIDNITALPTVNLIIEKTVNQTLIVVNNRVEFNITVTNKGLCNATNVNVTEIINDRDFRLISNYTDTNYYNHTGGYWYIGNLNVNETVNLTLVCEVLREGIIPNRVEVTSYENDTYPYDNWDIVYVSTEPIVDIIITKVSNATNGTVHIYDIIEFNITVHNAGPSNATSVIVAEPLDTQYFRIISNRTTTAAGYDGYSWNIGNLANNATETLTIVCQVVALGDLSNYANVTEVYQNDTNTSNNEVNITIKSLPIVDLNITKVVDFGNGTVNVSSLVQFTITVHNNGPCNATNVTVIEKLSPLLNATSIQVYGGKYNVTTGIWDIGDLPNKGMAQLIIQAKVKSNGTISNFVVVTSNETDTNMSNNNDTIDNITALPVVDLNITKQVNMSLVNVTGLVKFTINVTNYGPSNATKVNVTEILDKNIFRLISNETDTGYYNLTGGYWYIGNLDVNKTVNLTIVCQVIKEGIIKNRVDVTSYENDTDPYNNWDEVEFIVRPIVDIAVTKGVNVNGTVNVGDEIIFTITVHNNGPSNATSVMIYEKLNSTYLEMVSFRVSRGEYNNVSWFIGDLNNGSTETLNITARVISAGNFTNTVNATVYENDTNMSNNNYTIDNITALPVVDLNITKTVDQGNGTVEVGDYVQFTIRVVNEGPCDATNVTVIEKLSSLLNMTSCIIYGGGSYNVTTGIWYIGDLKAKASASLTIGAKVKSNGTISNFVVVTSNETDNNTSNNNYTIDNITALPVVDLNITKTVNASYINATDKVLFTIIVHNKGPSNATRVNVSEILDENIFKLISNHTDTGYYNLTGGYWYIGNLNANETVNLTLVCQVLIDGTFRNYVNVTRYENDTTSGNDWAEVWLTAYKLVDIVVTKEVNVTKVNVTDLVKFTINVTNRGPSNATGVYVVDNLDLHYLKLLSSNATVSEFVGNTWVIGNLASGATETLTIICEVISVGNITNFVFVNQTEPDKNQSSNNATVNFTSVALVNMTITKKANVTQVNVGEMVKFTINVTNYGPSNATFIEIMDVLDDRFEFVSTNVTWEHYYRVNQTVVWRISELTNGTSYAVELVVRVLGNGTIENVIGVTAHENPDGVQNKTEVNATYLANLTVIKKANITTVNVGEMVKFTINVTNYGPSNATDVNVTDVLDSRFEFVSANGTYTQSGQTVIWNIAKLPNGTSQIVELIVRVLGNGTIQNIVSVNSTENKTGTSNTTNINATYFNNFTIIKAANVTHVNVGEMVKFTITVTNYGPSNATDVNVTDILDSRFEFVSANGTYTRSAQTVIWHVSEMVNGSSQVFELIVRVLGNGTIENIVSVNSTENTTGTENKTSVNATYLANLTITKKANVTDVHVGEMVKFTITVTNYGPSNATDVNVTDVLDSRFEFVSSNGTYTRSGKTIIWNIAKLPNGTSQIIELIVRVLGNGTIENIVSVNSTENTTGTENKTSVNATYLANLTITKKANVTDVHVGEMVKFTITVTNYGPSNATDVNVTDILDSRFIFISANGTYTKSDQTVIWNIAKLPNGTSQVFKLIVRVLGNGTIENIVSVNSTENTTGTENKTSVNATYLANLTIVKKANVTQVNVGEMVKFTITVTNYGPSNATDVNVTDVLDSRFEFVSANGTYTRSGKTIIWNIPEIENNTSKILELIVRVLGNGTIENIVSVNSTENTTGTDNRTSVNATNFVNLTVIKTADVNVTVVGGLINFTITVTNNGPTNATDVKIADELIAEFEFVGATDGYVRNVQKFVWTIAKLPSGNSTSVWIQVRAMTNGTFTNVAIANSTENTTNVPSNESNVTVKPYVNLTISKTSNVTGQNVSIGDLVKFTITVTNIGLSNATNVLITDELSPAFEFNSTSGDFTRNGQKIVWKIPRLDINVPYTIELVVKTVLSGFYSNVAVGNSTDSENQTSNETIVTVLPAVNLTLIKKANVVNATVGDIVNFTIVVTNLGPSDATNVNITDKLPDGMFYMDSGSNITGVKGTNKNNVVVWNIQSLKNGESVEAWVSVMVIDVGTWTNVAIVNSTENTTGTSNKTNVTVNTINTPIDLDCYDIYYGDVENITVTLPEAATGTVNITVGNRTYNNVPINNGTVKLQVYDLAGGSYNVTVVYGGDGRYLPNSTNGTFKVLPLTPKITIEVADIWVGEVEVVNVTVTAPGTVFVTVNGQTVEIPLENGVKTTYMLMAPYNPNYLGNATWNIYGLPVGAYPAFALYPGNENYTSVNTSALFHVRDKPSTVVVTADDIYVGEDAIIKIQVGPKGVTGSVDVEVEGKRYTLPIDADGRATLKVSGLKAGLKHVKVWYNGTLLYRPSQNTTTFKVMKIKPPIDIDAPDIKVDEDGKITVTVPEDATGTITIKINGKTYTKPVRNGKAVFIIKGLKVGVHDIEAYYSGDDKYLPADTTGDIRVTPAKKPIDHTPVGLEKYPTGNPILVLLLVILALGASQIRRFKR